MGQPLDITKVQIHLMRNPDSDLKGFADIIISDCFIVRNIAIVQGPEYTYTAMPNRMTRDNVRKDVAHPITEDCRRQIEGMVLDAYEDRLNQDHADSLPRRADKMQHIPTGTEPTYRERFHDDAAPPSDELNDFPGR